MTLDDEPLEPIAIDDRSPGERMIAGGRAGLTELRGVAERLHFDTIALLWMLFALMIVGAEVYAALRYGNTTGFPAPGGFGGDVWLKALIVAEESGSFAILCVIGIAFASLVPSARARLALWIAAAVGAWTVVAGLAGVVAAGHGYYSLSTGEPGPPIVSRAVGSVRYFGFAGLGMLVVLVSWRLATAAREPVDLS